MKLARVVHDYVVLKQSMGSRFHTEATILKAFCKAVGDVVITDVEPQQVESYLAGTGPVTRYWHRKYEVLNGFYRFALGRGHVIHSPLPTTVPKRPQPFLPYIFSAEELRRLFKAVHRLVAWYREGADVQRLLPQLATYLGHVNVAATGSCQERCRII